MVRTDHRTEIGPARHRAPLLAMSALTALLHAACQCPHGPGDPCGLRTERCCQPGLLCEPGAGSIDTCCSPTPGTPCTTRSTCCDSARLTCRMSASGGGGSCAACLDSGIECGSNDDCCVGLTCRATDPDGLRRCATPCAECVPGLLCTPGATLCYGFSCPPGPGTQPAICLRTGTDCALPGQVPPAGQRCCRGTQRPDGRCCSHNGEAAGNPASPGDCCDDSVLVGTLCVPCTPDGAAPPGGNPALCCAGAPFDANLHICQAPCASDAAFCSATHACCDSTRDCVLTDPPLGSPVCCPRLGAPCGPGGFCCRGPGVAAPVCSSGGTCQACAATDNNCDGVDDDCNGVPDNIGQACCPSPSVTRDACSHYGTPLPGRLACHMSGAPPTCDVVDAGPMEAGTWCPPSALCDAVQRPSCGLCAGASCRPPMPGDPDPCAPGYECPPVAAARCTAIVRSLCNPPPTDRCYVPMDSGCLPPLAVGEGIGVCAPR